MSTRKTVINTFNVAERTGTNRLSNWLEVASITGLKALSMLKCYTHLKAEELGKKPG